MIFASWMNNKNIQEKRKLANVVGQYMKKLYLLILSRMSIYHFS